MKASLKGMIAWMKSHDPAETYDWTDLDNCLFAQYGNAIGVSDGLVHDGVGPTNYCPIGMADDKSTSWTFGKAIERAEALLVPA